MPGLSCFLTVDSWKIFVFWILFVRHGFCLTKSLLVYGLSSHFLMLFGFAILFLPRLCGWLGNVFSRFVVSLFIFCIKVFYKEKLLSFSEAQITWILLFVLNPTFQKFLLLCTRQPKKEVGCSVTGKLGSTQWGGYMVSTHSGKKTNSSPVFPSHLPML